MADIAALRGITQGTVTVGALPLSRTRLLPQAIAGLATDLTGEPLADDELAIVARSGHPWAGRARIHPRDLARARWVLPRVRTPTRTLFERALASRGLPAPDVVVETSDLAVLRGVPLNGHLLTAISPRQLAYELAAGLLVVLLMEEIMERSGALLADGPRPRRTVPPARRTGRGPAGQTRTTVDAVP